jgi:hypothetical protein
MRVSAAAQQIERRWRIVGAGTDEFPGAIDRIELQPGAEINFAD